MDDPPLFRLPQELLIRVASYLTTPELGTLRRTCKDVESKLFESFAHEFFHKRQFMIEEPSLQALVDISKHPTLSKRLTEVILSLDHFPEGDQLHSVTAQRLLLAGYANRDMLISSGQARDMLVEAFQNLPNLKRVGLRDYDAKGRYRDGHQAVWRSYGHSITEHYGPYHCRSEQPWTLLLNALGVSGTKVDSVEAFLRHGSRLSDGSFNVLSHRTTSFMRPVLQGLKTLMLSLSTERHYFPNPQIDQPRSACLKKFLHHTPNLEHLRLNFHGGTSAVVDWLALASTATSKQDIADYSTAPPPFPSLSILDLGMVTIETKTLIKILSRFQLKSFSLWKVRLLTENCIDIEAIDLDPDTNPVAQFLKKLTKLPALTITVERAMLGFMSVRGNSDERQPAHIVDFPPTRVSPDTKNSSKKDGSASPKKPEHQVISYRAGQASSFTAWAEEFASRAVVMKDPRQIYSSDSSDSSESEADSLEEDEEDEDE